MDAVRLHLHGHMAVAEMPGELRQAGHTGHSRPVSCRLIVMAVPLTPVTVARTALRIFEDNGIDHRASRVIGGGNDAGRARHGIGDIWRSVQPRRTIMLAIMFDP